MSTITPAQRLVGKEIKLVLGSSAELVSLLPSHGLVEFSGELGKSKVIQKSVMEVLARMDKGSLDKELLVRYLMEQVCEGVKRDECVFERFVGVLDKLGGYKKLVCRLRKEVDGEGSIEAHSGEINFYEQDVPKLLEFLNNISDKWAEIGLALEIPRVQIKQIKASSNTLTMKLSEVLYEWISTKENTTLKNLQQALAGKIVERPAVAKSLEILREVERPQSGLPAVIRPRLDSTLKVVYQSSDTEVADGKSILLEVQVSPNESVSYQWLRNGQPLSDGLAYSGVDSDILVISLARQGTEGGYACCISKDGEEVTSDVIILTVSFPPEKEPLILMYRDLNEVPQDSWPPVGACTFINLALIKKDKQSGSDHYNYSVRGSVDDILESKEKVRV